MYTLFGCKRWTLFHPEDAPLLYPRWGGAKLEPTFPSLHELTTRPDLYPLFPRARRLSLVLEPGQLLFVPGGTPHAVENLSDCLALAGNFVDDSNVEAALADLRVLGVRDANVMAVADALAEMELEAEEGMVEELLPVTELAVRAARRQGL